MAKQSFRRCVACRDSDKKEELLRFVVSDRKLKFDESHNLPGRGGYVHNTTSCLDKAKDSKIWARALKKPVSDVATVIGEIEAL